MARRSERSVDDAPAKLSTIEPMLKKLFILALLVGSAWLPLDPQERLTETSSVSDTWLISRRRHRDFVRSVVWARGDA